MVPNQHVMAESFENTLSAKENEGSHYYNNEGTGVTPNNDTQYGGPVGL